jgi:hypothetical protein
MARDANTLAHADRRSSQDHIHRNKRLGSRRSVAMTLGIMRPVRESSFSVILLAFPGDRRPEKWAAMLPGLPKPFGGVVRPGRESWNSA